MTWRFLTSSVFLAALSMAAPGALAAGGAKHAHPPHDGWSFSGFFGRFDIAQLQRGYRVYRDVCSACHSAKLLHFRNLGEKDGPFYNPDYPNPGDNPIIRQIASEFLIPDIDDETGDSIERPGRPADAFVDPFPNQIAAAASNGGAVPPDLSVIAKARKGGASYIYALLTGYPGQEEMNGRYADLSVAPGQYYNPYFPGDVLAIWSGDPRKVPAGGVFAMAPPLVEGIVDYDDGTETSVAHMAADVAAFLEWASDPRQTDRKRLGLAVMLYLFILVVLAYMSYRQVWRHVAH